MVMEEGELFFWVDFRKLNLITRTDLLCIAFDPLGCDSISCAKVYIKGISGSLLQYTIEPAQDLTFKLVVLWWCIHKSHILLPPRAPRIVLQ